ncbi:hypothetical protein KAX97_00975 [candidate division WOR-3 bacterium]|nr:hypothetical protein [candidate division WOR-3 bacterium]
MVDRRWKIGQGLDAGKEDTETWRQGDKVKRHCALEHLESQGDWKECRAWKGAFGWK